MLQYPGRRRERQSPTVTFNLEPQTASRVDSDTVVQQCGTPPASDISGSPVAVCDTATQTETGDMDRGTDDTCQIDIEILDTANAGQQPEPVYARVRKPVAPPPPPPLSLSAMLARGLSPSSPDTPNNFRPGESSGGRLRRAVLGNDGQTKLLPDKPRGLERGGSRVGEMRRVLEKAGIMAPYLKHILSQRKAWQRPASPLTSRAIDVNMQRFPEEHLPTKDQLSHPSTRNQNSFISENQNSKEDCSRAHPGDPHGDIINPPSHSVYYTGKGSDNDSHLSASGKLHVHCVRDIKQLNQG